ncbi:MAG: ABC transporter permease [Firmicutes bacterium]|nr:ABC transporter permease [Bacillota bacterium]
MGVVTYLIKRLIAIIITISAVIAGGYVLMYYAPGSFFNSSSIAAGMGTLAIQNPKLEQTYMHMFESRYGLNLPLWEQVLKYIWHSLTFNFGNSFENPSVTIISSLRTAFPISAELAVGSVILAIFIGVPLGIVAALKRHTWIDSVVTTLSMTGQAIPSFVLAVILVLIFGVVFPGILPINGWGTPADYVLPMVALSAANIGVVTRYMRGSLIEGMRQEYIRTAEAKGVRYWPLVIRHGIRNSLTALITVIGPTFALTVVSTVWVENIFSIPGLGTLLSNAFAADDIPLSITSVFILCLMVMGMNLLVDLSYSLLDPRVKLK